jgi:hypothetical protein
MASHIDPSTGRNKRETGKLTKLRDRLAGSRAAGVKPRASGAIRRSDGRPIEKRVDQKRRNRVYPPGGKRR